MGETMEPPVVVAAPSPRSPPKYPDLCGRRRLQLDLQILNREIGLIEEEIQSLDGTQHVSRCCKEVNEYVGVKTDPLMPTNMWKHKSCCLWRWLRSALCFSISALCCCSSGCMLELERPSCSCPESCSCSCRRCGCPSARCCEASTCRPSCCKCSGNLWGCSCSGCSSFPRGCIGACCSSCCCSSKESRSCRRTWSSCFRAPCNCSKTRCRCCWDGSSCSTSSCCRCDMRCCCGSTESCSTSCCDAWSCGWRPSCHSSCCRSNWESSWCCNGGPPCLGPWCF